MDNEKIFDLSRQGEGLLELLLNNSHLDCNLAAAAYREGASLIPGKNIRILIIDLEKIETFDSLALSLFPALRSLGDEKEIKVSWKNAEPKLEAALQKLTYFKNYNRHQSQLNFDLIYSIGYIGGLSWELGKNFRNTVSFIGELSSALWKVVAKPHKVRWRETIYYMDMCGSDALPISILICFLMGLILGFQGAIQLQKYGGDIFLADGVGLSIVKELGPLMVAMICTGRAGSAFAAEIGTMKVSEEIDALITMGFIPSRFLVVPKVIALVFVMPILTIFGDIVGIVGGMTVGYFKLGIPIISYYNRTLVAIDINHFAESMTKSAVFALIIAAVGCMRGFEAKNDAQGVGRAATSAVVTSIFLLIVADTLLTIIFSLLVSQ